MIRLKEIASECGVNVSTVSRALKDDPRVGWQVARLRALLDAG